MPSITVKITTEHEPTIEKIRRLLAWMHWNTRWGHSGTIAVDIDGDGPELITVDGIDLNPYVETFQDKYILRRSGRYEWISLKNFNQTD